MGSVSTQRAAIAAKKRRDKEDARARKLSGPVKISFVEPTFQSVQE